jgi:hypothetical protein
MRWTVFESFGGSGSLSKFRVGGVSFRQLRTCRPSGLRGCGPRADMLIVAGIYIWITYLAETLAAFHERRRKL